MIKKSFKIGLVTILWISVFFLCPAARADVLTDCQSKMPNFSASPVLDAADYTLSFRVQFEQVKNAYHSYMSCIFEGSTAAVLGNAGGMKEAILASFSAHSPNLPSLPDLLRPAAACLKTESLAAELKETSPETLLQPLLNVYSKYADYLSKLLNAIGDVQLSQQSISDFTDFFKQGESFKLMVNNELQNSIIAMDSAFSAVKALRQAFIMHVYFQCILKNLESYRRDFENLRNIVSMMPPLLENASMHK